MKKILSLILSVVIMISSFSCLSVVAGAENANAVVPDGYTPIYTAEDLRNIEKDMNASYLLMNDIDLTEATGGNGQYNYEGLGWMPIGSDWNGATGTRTDFNGVLDGNGHTIKGMRISISDGNPAWAQITDMYGDYHNIGLFSVVTGKVMNLNLESMDIVINCTSENTPALQVGGISGVNDGEIIYCATSGKINIVTYPTVNAGGIFGRSFNGPTVKYCSNNANIYCESENGVFVGGIAGFVDENKSLNNISKCFNLGYVEIVSNDLDSVVGGVFGYVKSKASGIVSNVFNAGEVKGVSSEYTSGVIGLNYATDDLLNVAELRNSYNTGLVRYTQNRGETWNSGNAIANDKTEYCYYLEGTGIGVNDAEKIPASELLNENAFPALDFENVWKMDAIVYPQPCLREFFCTKFGHNPGDETVGNYTKICTRCNQGVSSDFAEYIPIYTIEDLRNIEDNMKGYYLLMNDLDLTEATSAGGEHDYKGFGWRPIGSDWGRAEGDFRGFEGVFNGNGHTIKGMRIDISEANPWFAENFYGRNVFVGLFMSVDSGTIENLNMEDVNINLNFSTGVGLSVVGAIASYCDRPAIEFCATSGKINAVTPNTALTVGGLIGESRDDYCIFKNTSNNINIYVETFASAEVGGIAGFVNRVGTSGKVDACFNMGSITCMCNSSATGGLFGFIEVRAQRIANLFNNGEIKGLGAYTGGLVGRLEAINNLFNKGGIEFSYNTGTVLRSGDGGFYWEPGYAITDAEGSKYIMDSYYRSGSGKGYGDERQEQDMSDYNAFKYFDFDNIWAIDTNYYKYPYLRNFFCTRFGHSTAEEIIKEGTCKSEGQKVIYCPNCTIKLSEEIIPASDGHKFTPFIFEQIPTEYVGGRAYRYCIHCNEREYITVSPLSATGTCGSNLYWMYSDGFLYIYGSGDMYNWENETLVPWHYLKDDVTRVILDEYVTSIGDYAFYGFSALTEFNVPCFSDSVHFDAVCLPNQLRRIGANALTNCNIFNGISNPEAVEVSYYNCGDGTHYKHFKLTENEKDWLKVLYTEGSCSGCMGSWTTTKKATCDAAGLQVRCCSLCGYEQQQILAKIGHIYSGEWIIESEATCSSTGSRYKLCTNCGYKNVSTISKKSHTVNEWTVTKDATCTATGTKTGICTVCSQEVTASIATTSHNISSWTTTKDATCTATGTREGTCSVCSQTITETIAATGHKYNDSVISDVVEGETVGTYSISCSKCSYVYEREINYIPVYTADDLRNIDKNLGADYLLMNDIDLTELTAPGGKYDNMGFGWVAIGITFNENQNSIEPFSGIFNGNGYTIKGLSVHADESQPIDSNGINVGLFGSVAESGVVTNLELSDVDIQVKNVEADKIDIRFGAIAASCNGKISNCNVNGNMNIEISSRELYVGGVVGVLQQESYCYSNTNDIDITLKTTAPETYFGGIVGKASVKENRLFYCANNGDLTVSTSNDAFVGGIAGYVVSKNLVATYSVWDCFNTGNITGKEPKYTGGIIGKQKTNFISKAGVRMSYNAGLVKYVYDDTDQGLGYAIAHGKVADSYCLEGTGNPYSTTLLSVEEMKLESSYANLSFDVAWCFDSYDYPVLQNSFCRKYGHKDGEWKLQSAATCGVEGKEVEICDSCGLSKDTRAFPSTEEHTLGALTITVAPTKDTVGEGYRICKICGNSVYEEIPVTDDSGSCGDNLTWSFNDGILRIYGTGEMANWTDETMVPWYAEKNDIKEVIIADTITSIGNYAFYGYQNISQMNLPSDLLYIGVNALSDCSAFPGVENPKKTYAIFISNNNGTHNKLFKLTEAEKDHITVFDMCDYTETVVEAQVGKYGYTEHKCTGCGYRYETDVVDPILPDNCLIAPKGENTLVLFNSGRTSSSGVCNGSVSSCKNPAWDTIDNSGYDIFGRMRVSGCTDKIRLGLSFLVSDTVVENATVSINAYDVDEEGGEYDKVILVNETTGEEVVVGTLSGMNDQWNNTKISIPAEELEKGNIYHLEVKITDTRGGCTWWVYVRNVSIQISTKGQTADSLFNNAYLEANIDENGIVKTTLTLSTSERKDLKVEYDAVCANYQYGSLFTDISTSTIIKKFTESFVLDSAAPDGVYEITAYIKDVNGNVLKTLTATTGYSYYAVSYNSNGGTNTVPVDATPYTLGKTVSVLFNNLPTREGFVFLGWSTDKDASVPEYTIDGKKTFVIKDSDVILYAVWAEQGCAEHKFIAEVTEEATCTKDGTMVKTCEICGYKEISVITAEHKYAETGRKAATCTEKGYIEYTCSVCGEKYTEELVSAHQYVSVITKAPTKNENGIITYTCKLCGDQYTEEIVGDGSHILLVQDTVPWTEDNNPKVLNKLVRDGFIDGWTLTNTSDFLSVDLNEYEVILIANDQDTSTYNKLAAFNEKLCEYAQKGGTVVYGACDRGWRDGSISYALPGGVMKGNYFSKSNYIIDYSSSVVKGDLTDKIELTDKKLYGNFCSHTYFVENTLPADSNIILVDSNNRPTLVEYPYGDGKIIASGLTWEFYFSRVYENNSQNFSKSVYDDLLVFALSNKWCIGCKHATQIEEKPATCTADGYIREICSDCGDLISEKKLYALGHDTTNGYKVIKKATCEEDGLKALYCNNCNELIADNIVISASGHEYSDWEIEKEATCMGNGTRVKKCIHTVATDEYEACSNKETEIIQQIEHSYSDVVITMEATCIEAGLGYRKCSMCGDMKNEVIPAIGHKFSEDWVVIKEVTCEENGIKSHICENCEQRLDQTEIKAPGHNYGKWIYDVNPTCTVNGERHAICSECGNEKQDLVIASGHKYSNAWTIDTSATCTESGYKSRHCLNCDDKKDITEIAPTGHFMGEWIDEVVTTCTTDGEHYRICSVCEQEERETVTAFGHNYSSAWIVNTPATCTESGEKSHTCTRCGDRKDVTIIDPVGHIFGDWTITKEATAEENGIQERTCEVCEFVETEEIVFVDSDHAITGSVSLKIVDRYGQTVNIFYKDRYMGIGSIITANINNITSGDGGAFECTYQWYANDVAIEGATSETYTVVAEDIGKFIHVEVTAKAPYEGTISSSKKEVFLDRVENILGRNTQEGVVLSWDAVDYATEYEVYRCTNKLFVLAEKEFLGTTSETQFADTSFEQNKTYYYGIIARNGAAKSKMSDAAENSYIPIKLTGTLNNDGSIDFEWCGYVGSLELPGVYERGILVAKTETGDWVELDEIPTEYTYYNEGGNYEYFAVYSVLGSWISPYSNIVHMPTLNTPTLYANPCGCYVGLSWNRIPGAKSYDIYKNGVYIDNVTTLSYQDFEIDDSGEYKYEVKARSENIISRPGVATVYVEKAHNYGEEIVVSEPTCTENGSAYKICADCGDKHIYVIEANGHSYDGAWVIDRPATCTANGYKSHECTVCGSKSDVTVIAATGHMYGEIEYGVIPTCTEPGTIQQTCATCDFVKEVEIPELEHNYSTEWNVTIEPTCTVAGQKSHKCTRCDAEKDITEIEPLGHDYERDFVVDIKPTCESEGEKSRHCINCDDRTDITVIEKTEHKYSNKWTIDLDPTCTEDGEKSHHCYNCEDRIDVTVMKATGHSNSDWIIANEATCFEDGLKYTECENCKEKQYETIPAGNHVYSGWTVVQSATCLENGLKTRVCSLCDTVDSQETDALGHYYSTNWTVDKDATCTEDGLISHHCIRCESRIDETVITAAGHCFGSWLVEEQATCEKAGTLYRLCEICNEKQTKESEPAEHNFTNSWTIDTPATCTEQGVKSRHCLNCDAKTNVTRFAALGHTYGAWIFDSDATCTEEGGRHKECEVCGETQVQTVMALGHHHSSMWTIDKDPTCLTEGEKSHHCLRCDDKADVEVIECSGHIFDAWKITEEPTMDSEGMREHKCYNCDETETLPIAKLKRYTATFVADGDVVATVDFPEDATEIEVPEVPFKDKYNGEWENFEVRNKDFTVKAIYTPVTGESLDGITSSNKTEYYASTGEVEINLHAEAIEKTIVTTTTKPVPLDIVFVLDQSGSMADGNKTDALKNAVTSFSNAILEDAKTKDVEHRIAIVGFASGANNNLNYENTELLTSEIVMYNKVTDEDYKNALVVVNDGDELNSIITKAIKNIDAEGATKADLGFEMASNIFAQNPVSENRQRVVVFLTDGVPTSYSNFEYGVANAAIKTAHQIKNTYDATIYSVGVFDRTTSSDRNVNNFMNYVSSNYNGDYTLSKYDKTTTPAAAGYYLNANDVSKLSEVFTSIVEEAIIHTGKFDDVTLKYTLSEYFTLTSQQEAKLRADAIENLKVTNEQITITPNDNGTTTITIKGISPWLSDGKYVVDFTFRATANQKTLKSGSYRVGTFDSGISLGDSVEYEAVFVPSLVDVTGSNSMAIFRINGEIFEILRVSSSKMVLAPDVDFGDDHEFSGWNVPGNLTLSNECRIFDASLDRNEYVISWNINGQVTEQRYEVGSAITPPTVNNDEIEGMKFIGWDAEIPEEMPSGNLTFNAVYEVHYHNYTTTKEFTTCGEGGKLTYTCDCGDTYEEVIEPTDHCWEAIAASNNENAIHNAGFRCTVCGIKDSKTLRIEGKDTYQKTNANYSTATYELDYVDETGNNCQPDSDVQISVQLDEVFNNDIPENATATVYRVNDDGTRTKLESTQNGMNMTFTTDHFSTYEFEFTTEAQKYMFAQIGSVIDTENKIIFSEKYVSKDYRNFVSYLAPATIEAIATSNGYYGTGSTITLVNNGVSEEYKVIVKGDLNGDSVCDVIDCMLAELIRTGNREATDEQFYAANNDVSDKFDEFTYQNIINWALAS